MRLLVLGGTAWLGSLVVADAVSRGHDVTALARGESGGVPPGARFVRADRTAPGAFDEVTGDWDAIVDVSRQPGQVRAAVDALAERAGHWVLVSSSSVYSDPSIVAGDEDAPIHAPLDHDVMADMTEYGPAKAACERILLDRVGAARAHVARVSLIGGPGDRSGRGVYWPWRFAHPSSPDGRVLVPAATHPVQLIDVRDLAAWLVDAAETRAAGIANVGGETLSLAEHLAVARAVAGEVAGRVTGPVPVDDGWLETHDVNPWAGPRSLPLWLPPAIAGLNSGRTGRAESLGLRRRPLAETLTDTLAWREAHPDVALGAGLADADERELLAAL
jgi:2'-hydroxyisoflavone reductase